MDHETEMQKAIDGIRAIAGTRPEPMMVPGNVIAARAVPMPPPIPVAPVKKPTPFRGPAAYARPIPAKPQPVESPAPSQMQPPSLNPVAYKRYLASIGGPN